MLDLTLNNHRNCNHQNSSRRCASCTIVSSISLFSSHRELAERISVRVRDYLHNYMRDTSNISDDDYGDFREQVISHAELSELSN